MLTGMDARSANITSCVALVPAQMATGWTGRKHASGAGGLPLAALVSISLLGGALGAGLLLITPQSLFSHLLPWLVLFATAVFAWGSFGRHPQAPAKLGRLGAAGTQLAISIYGGYFGGGIGIMNLAMFASMGMTDVHEMNALKTILGAIINGVAAVTFVFTGAILWPQALAMTIGAVVGGYYGAHYAMKAPQHWIRAIVIVVGFSMSIYFFAHAYL
jgi:uncharacterized protein